MSYRDWGIGEGRAPEHHSTPSRRRAVERGQQEPVDTYLPQWAVESGVRRADGGGRHAAPDDDDEAAAPYPGVGWRAGTGRHREGDRRAVGTGPVGEHTAEWTLDTPQEQGYVGTRRAESTEDEPASGAARRGRPRRPQATWSGPGSTPAAEESDQRDAERPTRQAASDAWARPAVDPWEQPRPTEQPTVDPWDASGVHAWGRSLPTRRDQAEDTGRWDHLEHTGEWSRYDTGQWDRYAEVDRRDRTVPPAPVREGWASPEQAEEFFSGTRRADDAPRWMEASTSAPGPGGSPRRRAADPVGAGGAGAAPYRRRDAPGGRTRRRIEKDLLDPNPVGPIRPLVYTAACYLVPALLLFVGLLFLDGRAPAGCVTDLTGGGCDSPRVHAFASMVAGGPRFGLALASSLVVAVVLRWVGKSWRSATVALAAAVVGGGLSTVLISAVTGQPIG
ncbi:hypothetical protein [Micromonospora eburnea]|uniref:hypothetical protein n=1 Tax=Micromonospora eburnea TaxID=227316 RepID=UPI00114CAEC5|nr:hypothetical protein [Micromonospora eburnea]